MANKSVVDPGLSVRIVFKVILVQVLVSLFLFINSLLITTFFMKDIFFTTMRYILFAVILLSDSLFLILTDILLNFNYFFIPMQVWMCLFLYFVSSVNNFVTPLTLTVMTLERYVAVCLPLQHGELCSQHNSLISFLIICGLSSVQCIVFLSSFFAAAPHSYLTQTKICSIEVFILHRWQSHLRSAINQFYFSIMFTMIVMCYAKIMKVAKIASGKNKQSTMRGLRTVILHGFQLLLSLIQLWCPFIEAALLQVNFMLYSYVRYFNYIAFILTPRCLSPLIYGLRDELFFQALKSFVVCGLYKKPSN